MAFDHLLDNVTFSLFKYANQFRIHWTTYYKAKRIQIANLSTFLLEPKLSSGSPSPSKELILKLNKTMWKNRQGRKVVKDRQTENGWGKL